MAATLASLALSERIASFLTTPVAHFGVKLYTFAPTEKFMAHLNIAVMTGVVLSAPFFILQAGVFIWPALLAGERRYVVFSLLAVPFLFLVGAAAAYSFFAPVVLGFFLSFGAGDGVEAMWGLGQYLSLLAGMMLATGLLLQMPLLLLALFALGVTTPQKIASLRPYIVFLIFLLAGILTPPDVTSQIMLGAALYLLFELTLIIGRSYWRGKHG
jgi:sec-independent protein translocase protein TatC